MNNQVCALWVAKDRETGEPRKDKAGNTFFTGTMEINGVKTKVVAFLNRPKEKETQPDITVLLSGQQAGNQSNPGRGTDGADTLRKVFQDDMPDSSIPF